MKFILVASAIVGSTQAWWGQGHLLVARIAQDILEKTSPETLDAVLDLLKPLKANDAGYTEAEDKHPFVECAVMADNIKYRGGAYQTTWHFVDTPFLDDKQSLADYPLFKPDTFNVTEALDDIIQWQKHEAGYDSNFVYKTIMDHVWKDGGEEVALSTATRLMIHYAGDIHQPLHATSRVDDTFPAGDRGGNSFKLAAKESAKNLHAVWDSVIYTQLGYPVLPMPDTEWKTLGESAAALVEAHPLKKKGSDVTSLDPHVWAMDSFQISTHFLYDGITQNAALPQTYVDQAVQIAERQIVLGGYRLAHSFIDIHGKGASKFLW